MPPKTLLDAASKRQGIHNRAGLLCSPTAPLRQALQEQVVEADHFCHSCGRVAIVVQQLSDEGALSKGPKAI